MEKINTPLGELLETFTEWELQIEGNEKPGDVMASVISFIESKLKAEREVIEKVHNDSIVEFIEALGMEAETDPQRAKDYFTKTFKSYE